MLPVKALNDVGGEDKEPDQLDVSSCLRLSLRAALLFSALSPCDRSFSFLKKKQKTQTDAAAEWYNIIITTLSHTCTCASIQSQ